MVYIISFGAVCCGWALLGILGGERQRRLRVVEQARLRAEADAARASIVEIPVVYSISGATAPMPKKSPR